MGINDNRKIFIYGLIDPKDDRVRYVGWTINLKTRLSSHLCGARKGDKSYKNNWIRKLLYNNLEPEIKIIEETTYLLRIEKEQYWIKYYGRENLTNSTDGGEGILGMIFSEESKLKMSKRQKGRISPMKGKITPEEVRKNNQILIKAKNLGIKEFQLVKNLK